MVKFIAALGAILLFCGLPAASASVAEDAAAPALSQPAVDRERDALRAVAALAQKSAPDVAAIAAAMKTIIADPAFSELSGAERRQAYLLYGASLSDTQDYRGAQAPLAQATAMPQADGTDWGIRFHNSYLLEDYADAARCLAELARHWPKKLADYRDQAVNIVVRNVLYTPATASLGIDLLKALHAAAWHPLSQFDDADTYWAELVRDAQEHGDAKGAIAIAGEIRDPVTLLGMRVDKRFDAVVRADPRHYDVAKAFADQLAEYRSKAAAAPDKLEGVNAIGEILLVLNRAPEALVLVDAALARIAAKPDAYSDVDDRLNWTHDIRSRALFALGRADEGLAAMARGAAERENGNVNASQAINLADEYVAHDRPIDALAAVAGLDTPDVSPFGHMAMDEARACALFALGKSAELGNVLVYMKAHIQDGMPPYRGAMLCTGDLDAVAAQVIAGLADPQTRTGTLDLIQDYLPQPNAGPREQAWAAAWETVLHRPDVAAAIARVGRVESFPFLKPNI